jgi:hypothetical protein
VVSMNLLTLSCNECGAPLEVPESAKFVTCNYCSARLAVQHTPSAVYTEVIEKIGEQTERLAQEVEILKLQNELARIDREWNDERQQHMVSGKHGRHEPGAGDVIGPIVAVAIGLVFAVVTLASPAPGMALFGLLLIVFGIGVSIANAGKASAYATAREEYERRRHHLLARIREQESAGVASPASES